MISCPGTEDAMEGNELERKLGIPNNLNPLLVAARIATIKKNIIPESVGFLYLARL